jgi:hypothetical protein
MRSNDAGIGQPKELAQLLRLRQVRVDAAQAAVTAQRDKCAEAQSAVVARQSLIENNRIALAQHASYMVGAGAADMPRAVAMVSAFKEKLKEQLERNEYGLMDDEEHLREQQTLLREAQDEWLREQSRHDGIKEALQRSRRALSRRADIQAENDADELRPGGPLRTMLAPEASKASPDQTEVLSS